MASISKQWEKLTQEQFQQIDDAFLTDFRAPGSKNKFVAWDPFEPSSRYLKFLLHGVARRQSKEFFEAYRKIERRDVGNPLTVRCGECDIDADYLAAVEEWDFVVAAGGLAGVRKVVEVGGGFGRTCHTLLTLAPEIGSYTIVDLPPMLELSKAYLQRVRPGAPVEFVSNEDHRRIDELEADLVVNIDSFQEMPRPVIQFYMDRLVTRVSRFYTKNPVGKYLPGSIGQPDLTAAQLMDVFNLGACQEVIDIFDEDALEKARKIFVEAYRPAPTYSLTATKVMNLFPYFQHALYTRAT